jgi:hypothetical protein
MARALEFLDQRLDARLFVRYLPSEATWLASVPPARAAFLCVSKLGHRHHDCEQARDPSEITKDPQAQAWFFA